ncbi:hypothetical protein ACGFYV_31225 [Streptomyces sp. NPDC048297]|uniref:hypothetical protein n=1 Tax=Streptomyces sp. NPDC048297 TaxID=3365531 RepID=UPI00370F8890
MSQQLHDVRDELEEFAVAERVARRLAEQLDAEPGALRRLSTSPGLQLSTAVLTFLGDLLRGDLKKIGSRWHKLSPGQIATIVLAVLRHDQRLADMAGGNRISATTVRR